ncbi:MAG: VWA domain-containing protein [Spirochaetaceae bacterium]|jgi:hypothetical protein|nr:VWA domain-containing protein [Spirochaetaceae bacterium]
MSKEKTVKLGCFFLVFAFLTLNLGADIRTIPIDVYIIVDSSSAMERGREEAVSWLCTAVMDGLLQQGDGLWIWTAGEKPELVYSGTLGSDKEAPKTLIRSITFRGDTADYRGALREAQSAIARRSGRISYTLLISGSGAKDPPSREAESAGLLRYSRVESFAGWRVLTIGLDLSPRIRQSRSYYMNNQ